MAICEYKPYVLTMCTVGMYAGNPNDLYSVDEQKDS